MRTIPVASVLACFLSPFLLSSAANQLGALPPSGPPDSVRQQLATLTSSNGRIGDYLGTSVSISGNTIVVGANNFNGGQGAAYVFVKPETGWADMTQVATLTASDGEDGGDGFGWSVAISGNTIVVGAPGHHVGSKREGAAYVFVEPDGGWADMTETAELITSDGADGDSLGFAVSIKGHTAAISALTKDGGQGAVYVFVRPRRGWLRTSHFNAKLTALDEGFPGELGRSLAISDNTVVAGAWDNSGLAGAAYVFVKPDSGWANMTQTAKLTASDGAPLDYFGYTSLSTSAGGDVVVVGAYGNSDPDNHGGGGGAAYVFVEPGDSWANATETAKLTASNGRKNDQFGNAVAINRSGDAVAVAANCAHSPQRGACGTGAAFLFAKPASGWVTTSMFRAELAASGGESGDLFGSSISINGKTIVVGAYAVNNYQGAAYVFGR